MLKIWGRKNSSNVRKPLWAAEELGLAYEAIDAGGAFGVVDTPEYRAMNPNGRVPVIEDAGQTCPRQPLVFGGSASTRHR
jgi:glutathione S-transferase